MERTAEARWFFPGRATPAQIAWFAQGERAEHEKRRTDRYLDLAGNPDLGIKQREGKLELKARAAKARAFRLAGIAGRKDAWVKWSTALRGTTRLPGRWLPVAKARMVLSLPGCDVELARLEALGRRFFSLGFEATSTASLDRALARFFAVRGLMPGARLVAGRALSYPEWLASLR